MKGQIALIGSLIISTGCAFGTRHVQLSYPPKEDRPAITAVAEAASLSPSSGTTIVLVPFADTRSDSQFIGNVHNGFGMRTAGVVANNSVPEWVTKALKTELEAAGYSVNIESKPPSTGASVGGEILTVFCAGWTSYEGEVSFTGRLKRDGKTILEKKYSGQGSAGVNWGATSESYGQSLSVALRTAIRILLVDMNRVLSE